MKKIFTLIILIVFVLQCQQKKADQEAFSFKKEKENTNRKASTFIDLTNKGIGPIEEVSFASTINQELMQKGKGLYEKKCTVCHKLLETFIGPPPKGILKRRTPEWIMNMLLNTEEMLQKDSLAKALFMEFNGQLMTNQNLSEEEARAILEYFRILE